MPECQARISVRSGIFQIAWARRGFAPPAGRLPAEPGGGHFSFAEMLLIEHTGPPDAFSRIRSFLSDLKNIMMVLEMVILTSF